MGTHEIANSMKAIDLEIAVEERVIWDLVDWYADPWIRGHVASVMRKKGPRGINQLDERTEPERRAWVRHYLRGLLAEQFARWAANARVEDAKTQVARMRKQEAERHAAARKAKAEEAKIAKELRRLQAAVKRREQAEAKRLAENKRKAIARDKAKASKK